MQNSVTSQQSQSLTTADTTRFEEYLAHLGLPTENIIASLPERQKIEANLPAFVQSLDPKIRQDARYLSKFVAGAAIGLFDASLNYIWNEVVLTLRKKAIVYGLDMFFDAAIGGAKRELYQTEDDLAGLKDNTLINTCKKLELISDIVFTKLMHILTMRNDIGSSHPNTYSINAFELLGWLQTCVTDVLNDQPSESAIQIRAFIDNLKKSTAVLDQAAIKSMEKPLAEISLQNTDNLLNSIFGVYVSDKTDTIVKKNISLVAPHIWNKASDDVKYKLGVAIDGYKNNLYQEKLLLGSEFFGFCGGNKYKSLESRIIELDEHADNLLEARYSWDNFYNEPQHMRHIMSFISSEKDIPTERAQKIIKVVLICRIGKGIPYGQGVSPSGKPMYDKFFSLLGDNNIVLTLIAMHSNEVRGMLDNKICQQHMLAVLSIIEQNAISDRIKEILNYLKDNVNIFNKIHTDSKYKELTKNHINWG
jgi:hypothetical protein